jgi:hypothetical protein
MHARAPRANRHITAMDRLPAIAFDALQERGAV